MKFGLVEEKLLSKLDLRLPPDHRETAQVLQSSGKKGAPAVYCGCAKWGIKAWDGLLYPAGTRDKDYLSEYVKQFNAIEMNTTFYSMKKDHVISWKEQAPEGFMFCPKFNRRISHIKRLIVDNDDYLNYFLNTTSEILGENLGMSFLQLPENFGPKYIDRLENFLQLIPEDYPLAVELRHNDWYLDSDAFDRTFELLRSHQNTAVITDVAGEREILHMRLTTPEVFIRFNGYGLTDSTYQRIDDWVQRLKSWIDHGLQKIYFFPHQQDEAHTPQTCHYFITKMNKVCGLDIKSPELQIKQE